MSVPLGSTQVVAALVRPASKRYHASLHCAGGQLDVPAYIVEERVTVVTEEQARSDGKVPCGRCWRPAGYVGWLREERSNGR